jgi:phospholipid/cholesterol/gamma-HCH transport system substrate-binding protein
MSSRSPRIEFAVGAFLLLALASLLVLAIASTNGRLSFGGGDTYPVKARFTGIGQLRGQAPVKIGGVTVGKVGEIGLDPTTFDSVVTLEIDDRYELPGDTSAAILTSGLLGESYVALQPGGDPMPLAPGDELMLTQPAVDLMQLVGKYMFSGGGDNAPSGEGASAAPEPADPPQTEELP